MLEHVEPRIEGGEQTMIGEGQREYRAFPGVRARNIDYAIAVDKDFNSVIMALTLTGEQRQRIINGEDLYIAQLTFGRDVTPIMVCVGPEEMAEAHGLEVKKPTYDYTPLDNGEVGLTTGASTLPLGVDEQRVNEFTDLFLVVKGVREQINSWTIPIETALWVARSTKEGHTYADIKREIRKHMLNYEPSWREVGAIHEAVCEIYRRKTKGLTQADGMSNDEGLEML